MIVRIACHVQAPDTFSIEKCLSCRYFNLSKGEHISVSCRKNRSPKHRRDFEGAYLTYSLGFPDTVVVEETEETNG